MKLSEKEVKKIAKLARLGIGEQEIAKYQKDLSAILDFVGQLRNAEVAQEDAFFEITGQKNVWREDGGQPASFDEKIAGREKLVGLAPAKKDGYVKVKKILN